MTRQSFLSSELTFRTLDVTLASIALVFIYSWLAPILALLIMLSSKGSVYFKQERTGLNGKSFTLYKFRTMVPNKYADRLQSCSDDPRVTKIGRLLRNTGLDELPQIINVLKNEMSLVGPRPFMLYHTEKFSEQIEGYKSRLSVKPGLTGLAQVSGYRGEITNESILNNWIKLDLLYVKKRSVLFNLYILFRTLGVWFTSQKSSQNKKVNHSIASKISEQGAKVTKGSLSYNILSTLAYYDVFNHPLSRRELRQKLHYSSDIDLEIHLNDLLTKQLIFELEGYLSLKPKPNLVSQRIMNELRANKYLGRVPFWVKLISLFPYTRAVSISGSLSKGVLTKGGDIDYFIIAKTGRIWLNRTLLVLFKKLFLLNSKKYFCVNYFIADNQLEIEDKNIFTATEIAHLVPVYNKALFKSFIDSNKWYRDFLPNFSPDFHLATHEKSYFLKRATERILDGKFGDRLDDFCFLITLKRRQWKFKHLSKEEFELALRSKKNISKHHPNNFQTKVLHSLDKKLERFISYDKKSAKVA